MIQRALPLFALLAACQPVEAPPPATASVAEPDTDPQVAAGTTSSSAPAPTGAPHTRPQVAAGTLTVPANIVGEYRVAGVDGRDIDMPNAMTASVADGRMTIRSGCIAFAWNYTFRNGGIATSAVPVASCRRALRPPEEAVRHAMDAALEVQRTPENGIRFLGSGHTVTMFSQ